MAVDESSGPEGAGATLVGASCALLAALGVLGERGAILSGGELIFNGALIGVTLGKGSSLHQRPWLLGPIVLLSAIRYCRYCRYTSWFPANSIVPADGLCMTSTSKYQNQSGIYLFNMLF